MGLITKVPQVPKWSPMKLKKGHIVIPYTQGLCESITKICGRYGIQTHFKVAASSRTSWSPQGQRRYGQPEWCHILVPVWGPKLWWWIYRGNLKDFWWKIQRAPEGPLTYTYLMGYPTSPNNFQIIGRDGHNLARNIKESIFIRINNPTLNNNIGKFNLPHIWDKVLLNMPGLNLKRHDQTNGHVNNNNYSNTPF